MKCHLANLGQWTNIACRSIKGGAPFSWGQEWNRKRCISSNSARNWTGSHDLRWTLITRSFYPLISISRITGHHARFLHSWHVIGSKAELWFNPPTKCLLVGIFSVQLLVLTTNKCLVNTLTMFLKQAVYWLFGWTTDKVIRIAPYLVWSTHRAL